MQENHHPVYFSVHLTLTPLLAIYRSALRLCTQARSRQMAGTWLERVWVHCLERAWNMAGTCLGTLSEVSGTCLERAWVHSLNDICTQTRSRQMSGTCLGTILWDFVWNVPGYTKVCLEHAWVHSLNDVPRHVPDKISLKVIKNVWKCLERSWVCPNPGTFQTFVWNVPGYII
jgi:hypothetical protein